MKKNFTLTWLPWVAIWVLGMFACTPTEVENKAPNGTLEINFSHNIDASPLMFDGQVYENEAGNLYTIQIFNYYISNIKLRNRSSGDLYVQPESYHLIRAGGRESITVSGIPPGNYTELEFSIGVDNAKNYSTDQVGDLDPANNMAWDWNTGYKFLLLEGRFFPADTSLPDRGLVLHIGSDHNFQTITYKLNRLELPSLNFEDKAQISVQVGVEAANIFRSPTTINLEENNVIMFEAISSKVSENYATDVFSILSIN